MVYDENGNAVFSVDDFYCITGIEEDKLTNKFKTNAIMCRDCSSLKCDKCMFFTFAQEIQIMETITDGIEQFGFDSEEKLIEKFKSIIQNHPESANMLIWGILRMCDESEQRACIERLKWHLAD